MDFLNIWFENGKISDRKFSSSTHVEAFGWTIDVARVGVVSCQCSDDENSLRYIISEGHGRLTLRHQVYGGIVTETLKKGRVMEKGKKLNGLLSLVINAPIKERYAYFREKNFQEFMSRFGLSGIRFKNPNREFIAACICDGWQTSTQLVYSDGEVTEKFYNYCHEEEPEIRDDVWVGDIGHSVKNASWAIVERVVDYGDRSRYIRVLYSTIKDLSALANALSAAFPYNC